MTEAFEILSVESGLLLCLSCN